MTPLPFFLIILNLVIIVNVLPFFLFPGHQLQQQLSYSHFLNTCSKLQHMHGFIHSH